jgi:hypothetical protein
LHARLLTGDVEREDAIGGSPWGATAWGVGAMLFVFLCCKKGAGFDDDCQGDTGQSDH